MDIHGNDFDDELPPASHQPLLWAFLGANFLFFAISVACVVFSDTHPGWLLGLTFPAWTASRVARDFC